MPAWHADTRQQTGLGLGGAGTRLIERGGGSGQGDVLAVEVVLQLVEDRVVETLPPVRLGAVSAGAAVRQTAVSR